MRRPNILLITADQMRADCLGCAGHPTVQTPHLDAMAQAGARFTQAYTPYPICVPARYSIMTGMYAYGHGCTGRRSYLPSSAPTLPGLLQQTGYRTGAVGKMHFWPPYKSMGFEHMRLAEQAGDGWKVDDYHSEYLAARGLVDEWDYWDQHNRERAPQAYWDTFGTRPSSLPEAHYHTTWIGDETLAFIEAEDDRPFFLWTSFINPHHPFDPPRPWDEMYDPNDVPALSQRDACLDKPLLTEGGARDPRQSFFDWRGLTDDAFRRIQCFYYAMVSQIDAQVGRIVSALERLGVLDNTLIIFTSDHGDYMGDYGLVLKHPNVPYDSLARVPFVVRGPGVTPGLVRPDLVSLIDLLPTCVHAGGGTVPKHVHGRDLAPLCRDGDSSWREVVFIEAQRIKAVRTQRHKYLYDFRRGIEELYDLQEDPGERSNLMGKPSSDEIVSAMREHLLRWFLDSHWHWSRTGRRGDYRNIVDGGHVQDTLSSIDRR